MSRYCIWPAAFVTAASFRALMVVATIWSCAPAFAEEAGASAVEGSAAPAFHLDDASVPDLVRTPGEADRSARAKVFCQSEERQSSHPPVAFCNDAFSESGIPEQRRYQYECAFIIPPSIGGASTRKNVWLQPSAEAPAKRSLDRVMRKRVCDQEVSLAQAQKEVAEDWPAAYRRLIARDVAVIVYDPPAEEQRERISPQSNVSSNPPDKRMMPADVSQPETTATPPIEASVSQGSGRYRSQSGSRRWPDRSGHAQGFSGRNSAAGYAPPALPATPGPYRSGPRQVRR